MTPERAAELGVKPVSLDELLAQSDVVSLHAPGGAETKHLLGPMQFEKMKKGALLVNCARGALVDEAALVEALDSGKLGGAALDVFSVEPPKDFTLMKHPKVLCTPHLGASTVEAQDRVAVETVEMLSEALKGSPFVAAVNLPFPPAETRTRRCRGCGSRSSPVRSSDRPPRRRRRGSSSRSRACRRARGRRPSSRR